MKHIELGRSRKLLAYLLLVHSAMIIIIPSLLGVSWWSLIITLIVMVDFAYYAQQHQWLKARKSVVSIDYHVNNDWSLRYLDRTEKLDLKLTSSFVTPHLVILYFNQSYVWQRKVITILDDAVDERVFREVCVYLRSPNTFQQ